MAPLSKMMFSLNESMVDIAVRNERLYIHYYFSTRPIVHRAPAIKSRFFDQVRKEFESLIEKKVEPMKEVIKKQVIM